MKDHPYQSASSDRSERCAEKAADERAQFWVPCQCGQRVEVAQTDAGTQVRCQCGASVDVPPLSVLRRLVGKGAYESGIIDTINRMIAAGDLPWGRYCALSGLPTTDVLFFEVECEQQSVRQRGSEYRLWRTIFLMLVSIVSLFHAVRALLDDGSEGEERGHDISVRVPLLVARTHQGHISHRMKQKELRRLLAEVPVYAELLRQYPDAKVRPV